MINLTLLNMKPDPVKMGEAVNDFVRDMGYDSLPEYTAPTRLTPSVLIDKALTLAADDSLLNILQTMLSIYSAHYLQAVALKNNVNNVSTIKLLDQFSTDRDVSLTSVATSAFGKVLDIGKAATESIRADSYKLPDYNDPKQYAMEADDAKPMGDGVKYIENDITTHANLAVGRLLHVKIGTDKNSITMPVTVVLYPRVIESAALPNIMNLVYDDTSFSGRWHKWRAGEIESFIDYIFALDLIERDRKALLSDKSGLYAEARYKIARGQAATIATGRKSMNVASTMSVVSKRTAEEIELAMKGKLKNRPDRESLFRITNSMMLVVVDQASERLTIYQRGISDFGMYTYADIKDFSKKAGAVDIGSILKAYKLGESPSL